MNKNHPMSFPLWFCVASCYFGAIETTQHATICIHPTNAISIRSVQKTKALKSHKEISAYSTALCCSVHDDSIYLNTFLCECVFLLKSKFAYCAIRDFDAVFALASILMTFFLSSSSTSSRCVFAVPFIINIYKYITCIRGVVYREIGCSLS